MSRLNRYGSPLVFLFLVTVYTACSQSEAKPPEVMVFKSPTCSCCTKWVQHLTDEGFIVSTTDMNDVSPMKRKYGLPSNMASCHTAIVGGYVVEGHVPADVIRRMLKEKPDIVGISVPGMPVGTPGMEMGDRVDSYAVMAFTADGSSSVYEQR